MATQQEALGNMQTLMQQQLDCLREIGCSLREQTSGDAKLRSNLGWVLPEILNVLQVGVGGVGGVKGEPDVGKGACAGGKGAVHGGNGGGGKGADDVDRGAVDGAKGNKGGKADKGGKGCKHVKGGEGE